MDYLLPRDVDLSYLKLPKAIAEKVDHPPDYVRQFNGQIMFRKIYYNMKFDEAEEALIKEFTQLLETKKFQVPRCRARKEELHKYINSAKNNLEEAYKILLEHAEYMNNEENFRINENVLKNLESGLIYLAGRDKQLRPCIVINVHKIDFKNFVERDFVATLNLILIVAKEIYFYPGCVENWIVIIETNEMGVLSFPFNTLGKIIKVTKVHFPATMEQIYIMNPSFGLNTSWKIIEGFIEPASRRTIAILKKAAFSEMKKKIPESQIEEKYGGTLKNITKYWPPTNTLDTHPLFDLSLIHSRSSPGMILGESHILAEKKQVQEKTQIIVSSPPKGKVKPPLTNTKFSSEDDLENLLSRENKHHQRTPSSPFGEISPDKRKIPIFEASPFERRTATELKDLQRATLSISPLKASRKTEMPKRQYKTTADDYGQNGYLSVNIEKENKLGSGQVKPKLLPSTTFDENDHKELNISGKQKESEKKSDFMRTLKEYSYEKYRMDMEQNERDSSICGLCLSSKRYPASDKASLNKNASKDANSSACAIF